MAAIRSWGIPDAWPSGPPPKYVDGTGNVPEDERSRAIWLSKAGHYGHSQVPGNSHGDPGAISTSALFAAAKTATPGVTPTPPKPTPTISEVLDMQLDDVVIAAVPATATTPAKPAVTVRAILAKANWLTDQFSAAGQFSVQLDRIEAKP
jgi:hypothetical protein